MGSYIAKEIVKKLIAARKDLRISRVLIMGITFKENVSDIRNSKVVDVIRELRAFGLIVDVTDPHANADEVWAEYGFNLTHEPDNKL